MPNPHILAFIVEHHIVLSFSMNSKLFVIELYSPGDRKALIQHVPMTEAELLIFPELFLAFPGEAHCGGLSSAPAAQSLSNCGMRNVQVCAGLNVPVYFAGHISHISNFWKKINCCKNGLSCSSERLQQLIRPL